MKVRDQQVTTGRHLQCEGKPRYFDTECLKMKRRKRVLERKLRKYPTTENEVKFESCLSEYYEILNLKRCNFLSQRLNDSASKIRYLTFDEIFKRKTAVLPEFDDAQKLADNFNIFFAEKVKTISATFGSKTWKPVTTNAFVWEEFNQVTSLEIKQTCTEISNSTSNNDIVPTNQYSVFCLTDKQHFIKWHFPNVSQGRHSQASPQKRRR